MRGKSFSKSKNSHTPTNSLTLSLSTFYKSFFRTQLFNQFIKVEIIEKIQINGKIIYWQSFFYKNIKKEIKRNRTI